MTKKHVQRHRKRAEIRAAAKGELIRAAAIPVEWIAAKEGEGEGVKRFTMTAYNGRPMSVDYYSRPVVIDLAGLTAKAPLPILANHDPTAIVGHADEIEIGVSSLKLSGLISGAGPMADQVQASAGKGFPWKASVGARPDQLEFVDEKTTITVNGKSLKGPLYVARKATLGEVSFVAIAADASTKVKVAAQAAINNKEYDMDFEKWVEAMGLTLADLREDQTAKLQAKYDAEVKAAAAKSGNAIQGAAAPTFDLPDVIRAYEMHVSTLQAKAAEYAERVDAAKLQPVSAAAGKQAAELKASALRDEWPAPRLEAEYIKAAAIFEADLMRAERPKGVFIHASTRDGGNAAIEAAFSLSAGLRNPEKHFKEEVLEASTKHFHGFSIQELLLHFAREGGYDGRARVTQGNLREVIRAAFSTHSISTMLTSTGNKILLDGFMSIPQTWRAIAGIKSVSDFKTVTAYRLTSSLEYEEVGPGGEIKHGTLGQESYDMAAKTYAKMAALTRQDIINDDLGAFDALRSRLGLGSAIKMNKVFWTLWINNSAFFTSARVNYQSGAGTVLGDAGLAAGVQLFRDMPAPDGNLMSLEPALLLVPSVLEPTAKKYYVSQEIRDTTASTKTPIANIYFNQFRPVIVPELGNSAYTGYSATAWFLLADPTILATAVMCFLDGQQAPTIESSDADFDTLGVQFRGYHDFGAAMTEYRAGVKSAGA